jgi:chitinase
MKKRLKRLLPLFLACMLLGMFLPQPTASAAMTSKRLIVYFPDWGIYNASHKSMTVGMIPWSKVTCVNHAFFEVDNNNKLATIDYDADFDRQFEHSGAWGELRGHMGEYKYYKTQYPNVKIMISVGGWTRGQNFHKMALTRETRATFIQSVVDFLKQYPFIDGIDIDWEYPGVNRAADPKDQYDKGCPGGPEDKENFTALFKELRAAYNANGLSDKLLTTAIAGGYDKLELQEPDKYAQYLDWLNVMTFDFHGAWENITNNASPMYANPNDPSPTSPIDSKNKYNVDYAMRNLRDNYGIPASKLNAATPYYSRGWIGVSGGTNGLFANATGAATGSWDNPSAPGGQYPYFTLLTMENANGYVKYRDSVSNTPYLYNASSGTMFTYEDQISLSQKCDYVNDNGYGGMMVWEISGDDNNHTLTNTIYNKLINNTMETVAIPVFSPAEGAYNIDQSITISCATPGAAIRYTTDGSDPTSASAIYTGPISLKCTNTTTTTTIRAIAFKPGMNDSLLASSTYTMLDNTTVAPPIFHPAGGTYNTAQDITISCATSDATIRYTTDGSTPTSDSSEYTGPIKLTTNSSTTIKAKALKAGLNDSTVTSADYDITNAITYFPWATGTTYKVGDMVSYNGKVYQCVVGHTAIKGWEPSISPTLWSLYTGSGTGETVAAPTFNPPGGNYSSPQSVTISDATSGAQIRYTTDGSEPTVSSPIYSSPIPVPSTTTIKAIAYKSGAYDSNVAAVTYIFDSTSKVAAPTFNPAGGTYNSTQLVTISCATTDATIRYTTDGSVPTADSTIYTGAIDIASTTTLKAIAMKPGMSDSDIAVAAYTINLANVTAEPVFNPTGGTYSSEQSVVLSCATSGAVIRYTTDGSTPNSSSPIYSDPIKVASTATIKAYATASGMSDSAVVSAAYTINKDDTYPAWAPNIAYKAGEIVSYNGKNYKCIQAHTSLAGWEPSNVPALWQLQ